LEAVTIIDVMPAALTMQPIRCTDWLEGLLLRWNYSRLIWEWASSYTIKNREIVAFWQPLENPQGMLTPVTMLSPKWEVVRP
jgi:hypothetical protein